MEPAKLATARRCDTVLTKLVSRFDKRPSLTWPGEMIHRNATDLCPPRHDRMDRGRTDFDIIIAGGGPAGLSLALALHGTGLRVAVVERQGMDSLAAPTYDGREIALTHRSVAALHELGAWQRIPAAEIFPLRNARVLNGGSHASLNFTPRHAGAGMLGRLVSNHLLRRALLEATMVRPEVTLLDSSTIETAAADKGGATVRLQDGREFGARMLVAADSRFSALRRQLGITAEMNRLGRTMLVCRVEHESDHDGVATEWFDHLQTLALLPLGPHQSSAVLTVSEDMARRLSLLDDEAFGRELSIRYRKRWGRMQVASSRHAYPLVTTYAGCFFAPGAVLVGDAAVGMHPVTAHGFNLGLSGAVLLAQEIKLARRRGCDWADASVLRAYEQGHRFACRPLYSVTNAIVRLFTDDRAAARIARVAAIEIGRRLPMVQSVVQRMVLHA